MFNEINVMFLVYSGIAYSDIQPEAVGATISPCCMPRVCDAARVPPQHKKIGLGLAS